MQNQYVRWRNGCVKKQSPTDFVAIICRIICCSDGNHLFNDIHGTVVCKEPNQTADAARLICVGNVKFASYLETAEDSG